MELSTIEQELKKAIPEACKPWGGKQVNYKDYLTNKVVYSGTVDFDKVKERLNHLNLSEKLKTYAIKRWYNFTVSEVVKDMFLEWPNVTPEENLRHKTIDLYIDGTPFDLKGPVFPRNLKFDKELINDREKKLEIISWLYGQQSTEGRFHLENKLFVVYYSSIRPADALKSDLSKTKQAIDSYMSSFDKQNLIRIGTSVSDIIWVVE